MIENKILVIRGGAIGDFILTLPVLAALRDQFPQTRLEVLGYPHIAQLALAGGLADAVRSIEAGPLAGFFARGGTLHAGLQEYFGSFALILSYLYDPDQIFRANVGRCSRAQFIAGPHRPNEAAGRHATDIFLQPLERLAIFEADNVPRLQLGNAEGGVRKAESRPTLALHPGSGSERKNWPEARWAELVERLLGEETWDFLLVGGEAEGARLDRLAALAPPARLRLARSLPLAELAVQMAQCDGFIGHDSGISHLAAAVGLRTIVLWGETPEAVWRPQGDHVTMLRATKGLAALPVETVWNRVKLLSPGGGEVSQ